MKKYVSVGLQHDRPRNLPCDSVHTTAVGMRKIGPICHSAVHCMAGLQVNENTRIILTACIQKQLGKCHASSMHHRSTDLQQYVVGHNTSP